MLNVTNFFKDARHFQIVYLFIFISYGLVRLDWHEHLILYCVAIVSALGTQLICSLWTFDKVKGMKSALITALGLILLLRTNSYVMMAAAAAIGISAKFILRWNEKHLFNPSNIGIVLLLMITDVVWVSPGQWGNDIVLLFIIIATGSIVLLKVGRLDVSYVYLASLFALEYIRTVLFLGWGMDVLMHKFTSGSLMLFTFFMITDPKTTPDSQRLRYLWAVVLAVLTFILTQWFYMYTASVWALFLITPLTLLMDKYYPAKKFSWFKDQDSSKNLNLFNNPVRSTSDL